MKKQILYINYSVSNYRSCDELHKRESHTLLYKNALTKNFEVTYLLRNQYKLEPHVGSVAIKTGPISKLFFLFYSIKLIRGTKIQFVILHGTQYFLVALLTKLLGRSKVILQHHAEKTFERKSSVLMPIADKFIDAYFFCGRQVARPFFERKLISENKIVEVIEGTSNFNALRNKIQSLEKNIICISRLIENKNVGAFLKALSLLSKIRNDFKAQIYYSSSELEAELKEEALALKIDHLLSFKGKVNHSELERELNACSIFVSASFYEGGGYALIEALACGAFPVVSNIPSFSFLIDGLLQKRVFDPYHPAEFAKQINEALELTSKEEVHKQIRKHFEDKLSDNAIATQIEKALEDI